MNQHTITFNNEKTIQVPTGTLVSEAAQELELDLQQPCGGQGRCGRCAVRITQGKVRQRSTLRLSKDDLEAGFSLACQAIIETDVAAEIPPQEKIRRLLTSDRTIRKIQVPEGYSPAQDQRLQRIHLELTPPSMDDQTDDWSRVQTAVRQASGIENLGVSLPLLRQLSKKLRDAAWNIHAVIDHQANGSGKLLDILPGDVPEGEPLWGAAVDIGTTTVSVWLVNLDTGEVAAQTAEYNGQISRGEDVISRIIYASKNNKYDEMRRLVLNTINTLLETVCKRARIQTSKIYRATIAGNSTMVHLFLGIPAETIRLAPFVTSVNHPPPLSARTVELAIHPEGLVDCLPGVASYVGADITAGVLSAGVDDSEITSLFIDVGTNGEIVLGSKEWLVTCACSAGPAFEGAGVNDGMRATNGAIEEIWINSSTYEPSYRVIGKRKPKGLCGSALISLIAELFLTGVLDKGGHFNTHLDTPRVRKGEQGWEYVIAWGDGTHHGRDIALTHTDVDNLLRAKAAIYAGFTVLADSIGIPLEAVERVLIGGAFGKYINIEKAIEIGLLPDMPWENFHFLGNTSIRGAYQALLDRSVREQIREIASRMTYIELSADNSFYEAFTSALFLPHTDMQKFPSIAAELAAINKKAGIET